MASSSLVALANLVGETYDAAADNGLLDAFVRLSTPSDAEERQRLGTAASVISNSQLIEHLAGRLEKARWTTKQQPQGHARAEGSDALSSACRQCSEGSTVAFRLLTHVFVSLFKEQFEGASGAQQPGVAVLQTMAQQILSSNIVEACAAPLAAFLCGTPLEPAVAEATCPECLHAATTASASLHQALDGCIHLDGFDTATLNACWLRCQRAELTWETAAAYAAMIGDSPTHEEAAEVGHGPLAQPGEEYLTANWLLAVLGHVMTFVIRGSGYVSRKLACVAGAGEPLPQDLQPYMETLSRYRQQIMLLAWKLEEAEPTSEQLEAWLSADGGPMTLIKGFAAGTPGFSPYEGKYGALAVSKALELSDAPKDRALAVALLEAARQAAALLLLLRMPAGDDVELTRRAVLRGSLKGQVDIIELDDGRWMDDDGGYQGMLFSAVCFCLESLYNMCAEGWLGDMGGEAVPADNAEAQSQGADVWRTLEALLRIAGSEFSLRDSCIFKQAFPETYYTMVLDVALECSRTLAPEMGRRNALSFAVTLRKALAMHSKGDMGERNLFMLAVVTLQRAAVLARTEPDVASAVVIQLLPPLARWVEADRVDRESAWDLHQALTLLAPTSGVMMAITDACKVLRFVLRFPAETRARITRAAEGAADPSSDDAQAEGFFLGHDKDLDYAVLNEGQLLEKLQQFADEAGDEAGSEFWTRLLRRALVQLAGTADQLLPWLPDEVDRLEMRAAQMSKDSTQVRSLAGRVLASVREMAGAAAPQPMPLEERRMALPGVGCWSPRCRNMTLPAEDTLSTLACGACGVARYCSVACQKAHWRRAHKEACRRPA